VKKLFFWPTDGSARLYLPCVQVQDILWMDILRFPIYTYRWLCYTLFALCLGARYPLDEDPEVSDLHLQTALLSRRLDLALLDIGPGMVWEIFSNR
jgi:hypothetical protein